MIAEASTNFLTIDLGRLRDDAQGEADKLFEACRERGIFYLDLQDDRCSGILQTGQSILARSKNLFDLSEEDKLVYDVDNSGTSKMKGYLLEAPNCFAFM